MSQLGLEPVGAKLWLLWELKCVQRPKGPSARGPSPATVLRRQMGGSVLGALVRQSVGQQTFTVGLGTVVSKPR